MIGQKVRTQVFWREDIESILKALALTADGFADRVFADQGTYVHGYLDALAAAAAAFGVSLDQEHVAPPMMIVSGESHT